MEKNNLMKKRCCYKVKTLMELARYYVQPIVMVPDFRIDDVVDAIGAKDKLAMEAEFARNNNILSPKEYGIKKLGKRNLKVARK